MSERPHFSSVEDYVAHVEACVARGRAEESWEPATRDELLALANAFPDEFWRWRPNKCVLKSLGLPPHFGKQVKPFNSLYRERSLQTIIEDDDYGRAFIAALKGAK